MARHDNGKVRKEANRGSPTPTDTGVGDSNRIRLPGVQRPESEPAPTRHDIDSLARAKADFVRRIKRYHSTRGRVSTKKDFRFQPIVNRDTHERIRAARRRLKHEPFDPILDIPSAVNCDFNALHSHDCNAYTEVQLDVQKEP